MTEPQAVLDCPMEPNDADATTVRDYLVALVRQLWTQGEGFSSKRPFGSSSWEHDVYASLGKAGFIDAAFDSDGYLERVDSKAGDALVLAAITVVLRGTTGAMVDAAYEDSFLRPAVDAGGQPLTEYQKILELAEPIVGLRAALWRLDGVTWDEAE